MSGCPFVLLGLISTTKVICGGLKASSGRFGGPPGAERRAEWPDDPLRPERLHREHMWCRDESCPVDLVGLAAEVLDRSSEGGDDVQVAHREPGGIQRDRRGCEQCTQ